MTAAGAVVWVVTVAACVLLAWLSWRAQMPLLAGLMAVCGAAVAWEAKA